MLLPDVHVERLQRGWQSADTEQFDNGTGGIELRCDSAIIDSDTFGIGYERHIGNAIKIRAVIELLAELSSGLLRPSAHGVGRNTQSARAAWSAVAVGRSCCRERGCQYG